MAEATLEGMAVRLELVASAPAAGLPPPASAGRATGGADQAPGPTRLLLLDLPAGDGAPADRPRLWLAAAGPSPGWRRAELEVRIGTGGWTALGPAAARATMGVAATLLPPAGGALFDERSVVEVLLLHDGMELAGRDDVGASAEANLALVGDELVQFARAERLGPARWRLSRLLRGRRGTEWAAAGHAAGERFVLLEPAALTAFDPPASAIGGVVTASARGVGDAVAVEAGLVLAGRALQPPAPVHLTADRAAGGDVAVGWTRRSRTGFGWVDGVEAGIGEAGERYRLVLSADGGGRTMELSAPAYVSTAAARAADGIAPGALVVATVRQVGDHAVSEPATILFAS